jgi:membrane protein implicated in regulation of membrane protease activity
MSPFDPLSYESFPVVGQGVVTKTISVRSRGRVKFQASYWMAKFLNDEAEAVIEPGETVQIVGRVGNTLLVKAMAKEG